MTDIKSKGLKYFFPNSEIFFELSDTEQERMIEIIESKENKRAFVERICKLSKKNNIPLMYVAEFFDDLLAKEENVKCRSVECDLENVFDKNFPPLSLWQCFIKTMSDGLLLVLFVCMIYVVISFIITGDFIREGLPIITSYILLAIIGTIVEYDMQKRKLKDMERRNRQNI